MIITQQLKLAVDMFSKYCSYPSNDVAMVVVVVYDMLRGRARARARARARKMKGMEEDDAVSEEVVMQFKEENQQENK